MYVIAFGNKAWAFPVGPESLEVSYPARSTATPTFTAAYVDMFGPGIGSIQISATTGWGVGSRKGRPNGNIAIKQLIMLYKDYLVRAAAAPDPTAIPMTFADGFGGHAFLVTPDASGLRVQQQKSSPLLRRFSLSLIILHDLTGGKMTSEIEIGKLSAIEGGPQPNEYVEQAQAYLDQSPALQASSRRYEVQEGDTVQSIADMFGVDVQALLEANGIRFPSRVKAGLVLDIP